MHNQPILVLGSSGKTGSRITKILTKNGHNVRYGSRSAERPFDWDNEQTWHAVLNGVSAVYISYFPDLAFPGAVEKVSALCEAAKTAGVTRLVLLSGRGEHHAKLGEDVVRNSGIPFTIIRAAWFAQNFSEGYLTDPVVAGVIAMPGGDVREPIIDVDDIADVAVAALTEEGHDGKLYEVTGPRLMTFSEMASELKSATGRPITYVPITFEDFHAGLVEVGGEFVADVFTGIARETLDGRNAHLCDGVQEALGRPPRDFAEFARRAVAMGAWKNAA